MKERENFASNCSQNIERMIHTSELIHISSNQKCIGKLNNASFTF